ncbi:MAG: cytochrome P450 [Candidatus Hydrogenedens sp.]|nr:cytochrome P450 [Candidatus Hydrogenedens sp.]
MSAEAVKSNLPPGPTPFQALSRGLRWHRDRIHSVVEAHELYGDVAMSRFGRLTIIFVAHPEAVQECLVSKHRDFHKSRAYFALRLVLGRGLVTSEDEFHLRQRRMIQPAFHRERVLGYGIPMIKYSAEFAASIADGQRFDMNRAMMQTTLKIVGEALFSSNIADSTDRVGHALDTLMHMDAVFLNPLGPFISKLPIPINTLRKKMTAELDDVMFNMIREHRERGDQGDLLSMLLAARDEDDGTGMTDKQVRDEAVTLFLAGHETTANALTWTWYTLSQHPEVEAKFHAELAEVLGGRDPEPKDYEKLVYTRQVLAETMRLFPPVWTVAREAIRDTTLGGYDVPKGAQVVTSTYVTHRDPRWWKEPLAFRPERFAPGAGEGRPKFAYYPFGGGKRLCIGEGFAWMEGVLVLAAIGQRWRFQVPEGHVPDLDPHITLRPKNGLPMIACAR